MTDVKTENTIKRLELSAKNAPEDVKKEIQEKINALKSGKIVQK